MKKWSDFGKSLKRVEEEDLHFYRHIGLRH